MKLKGKKIFLNKLAKKKLLFIVFLLVTFLIGIVVSVLIYNKQNIDINQNIEVTFIDSHQAIVFWKTQDKTVGYIEYGFTENNLDKKVYQTSSEKGTVHAVVIEEIPIEGVYISLHNESDSPFLFKKTQRIVFDPEKYIE